MLAVRFWGVRGSCPVPGPGTVVYGGNTSCLEIRAGDRLLIVDCGTGIRPLGDWLLAHDLKEGPLQADIFITHTHWDHLLGFPMFMPLFYPGTKLTIWGPLSFEEGGIEAAIRTQLSYLYWPVRKSELAARIEYAHIGEDVFDLGGGLTVTSKFLNHPVSCLGYRFAYEGKSIAVIFDHEPFKNPFTVAEDGSGEEEAREGELVAKEENEKIIGFLHGAGVVIFDTQYTAEEYRVHQGFGHSTYEDAIRIAGTAEADRLFFFHHDPGHTDSQLEAFERTYRVQAGAWGLKAVMAREGLVVEA